MIDDLGGAVVLLYTEADRLGGAEVVLQHLVRGLGSDMRPVVAGPYADVVHGIAAVRPGTEVRVVPSISSRRDLAAMRAFRDMVSDLKPDLVHFNLIDMGSCLGAILAASTLRSVAKVAVEHSARPPYSRGQRLAKVISVRLLDAHVVVSVALVDSVARASLQHRSKVSVICNGVDVVEPASSSTRTDGIVRIGVVSRLEEAKGVDLVVRALADVPGAELVIAGDGPARSALEHLASELGVADRVTFRGWVHPTGECYCDLDVYVIASHSEVLSMSVLEAMQRGLPVVATDVGGLREAVNDGVTGFVVPPDDVPALAAALRRLIADPTLRRSFGDAGLKEARERFSAPMMVENYLTLYRGVMARERRGWVRRLG